MKAFVLAAGIGSRLKPLTDTTPKALVEIEGVPMLEHIILKLKSQGFDRIIVNVYHLADQIIDFLQAKDNFGINISISDERPLLLDTGGAIYHARELLFSNDSEPVLIHNVDIISNCHLGNLMECHRQCGADATMMVSERSTNRYLLFSKDDNSRLCGWTNKSTGECKPAGFSYTAGEYNELAYSGIQVISPCVPQRMHSAGYTGKFSIVDFYLNNLDTLHITPYQAEGLRLIDIGKPETLVQAAEFMHDISNNK